MLAVHPTHMLVTFAQADCSVVGVVGVVDEVVVCVAPDVVVVVEAGGDVVGVVTVSASGTGLAACEAGGDKEVVVSGDTVAEFAGGFVIKVELEF